MIFNIQCPFWLLVTCFDPNMNNYNVVIDEISYVGVRMLNVINNQLMSIKHIQNKFFNGVDVIMIGDFYQAPLVKDNWIFQNIKNNVNALTPTFWQPYANVMN